MSNIGRKSISIPSNVQIEVEEDKSGALRKVKVTGSKGSLETNIASGIGIKVEEGVIKVFKTSESANIEQFYGLTRSLIANSVKGVSEGYEKKLELIGVGYRARVEGRDLVLSVGFAVPVRITPPDDITVKVDENIITVQGINKQLVGDFSSKVKKVRPPDSYKGKGIRYLGEYIRKKAGKAAAKTTA